MKSFPVKIFSIVWIAIILGACSTHKKPKCRTCPKWEDHIQSISYYSPNEEQHQSGIRP